MRRQTRQRSSASFPIISPGTPQAAPDPAIGIPFFSCSHLKMQTTFKLTALKESEKRQPIMSRSSVSLGVPWRSRLHGSCPGGLGAQGAPRRRVGTPSSKGVLPGDSRFNVDDPLTRGWLVESSVHGVFEQRRLKLS